MASFTYHLSNAYDYVYHYPLLTRLFLPLLPLCLPRMTLSQLLCSRYHSILLRPLSTLLAPSPTSSLHPLPSSTPLSIPSTSLLSQRHVQLQTLHSTSPREWSLTTLSTWALLSPHVSQQSLIPSRLLSHYQGPHLVSYVNVTTSKRRVN